MAGEITESPLQASSASTASSSGRATTMLLLTFDLSVQT
jgi:hypothetical protein